MATITATYSKKHTTGLSIWNLDKLGIDPKSIESYYIKWDKLHITFKDEDRAELITYPNEVEVESFDDVNGHEWVKYPMREKADFKITESV
jgi:hypothetical protein